MSKLRRYFRTGDFVFVTHVTYRRQPILATHAGLFLESLRRMCHRVNVAPCAWVVLPDHVHVLLDAREADVPGLMHRIKLAFSAQYRAENQVRQGRLWQLRYWDHIIRDAADRNRHIDYIHYNPVRHGYVTDPMEWESSSFREFIALALYEPEWGVAARAKGAEFGE